MTESMIQDIKTSWEYVSDEGGANMMVFYDKLFKTAPEARKLFPKDISKQSEKLAYTVGFVVANIDRIGDIKGSVEDLGRIHNKMNIDPGYYPVVRDCLIETIRDKMGADYRQDIGDAWRAALDFLSEVMINAPEKRENRLKTLLGKLFH